MRRQRLSVIRKIKRKGNIIFNSGDFIEFLKKHSLYEYPLNVKSIICIIRNVLSINILVNNDEELNDVNYSFSKIADRCWLLKIDKKLNNNLEDYITLICVGHYFLHRNIINIFEDDLFFIGHIDKNTMKYEAIEFANKVLMPEEKIREFVENGFNTIEKLAIKFNLPETVIRVVLKELTFIK